MAQPDDHPPAGGLLHHLLTLTLTTPLKEQDSKSGYFLLPTPTVTNSFYFRKWDALCCPDFPPAFPSRNASDRPERCFQSAKVQKTFESLLCFFTFFQYYPIEVFLRCIIFFLHLIIYICTNHSKCRINRRNQISACSSNLLRALHHQLQPDAGHATSR